MAINWQSDGSQVAAKVGVTSVRREEEEEAVSRWPEGRWCSSVAAKSELRWPAKPPPAGANWGPDDGSPLATGCPRQPSDDGAPPARPAMAPATAAAAPATTTPAAPLHAAVAPRSPAEAEAEAALQYLEAEWSMRMEAPLAALAGLEETLTAAIDNASRALPYPLPQR